MGPNGVSSRSPSRATWALLLTVGLLASACSAGRGTVAESPAAAPEVLDFTAPAVGGGRIAGAELAGAPVALWFWAPW